MEVRALWSVAIGCAAPLMKRRRGRVLPQQLRRIWRLIRAHSRLQHNWWPNWKAGGGGGGEGAWGGGRRESERESDRDRHREREREEEKEREREGKREAPMRESLLVLPQRGPTAEGIDVSAEAFSFYAHLFPPPISHPHTRSTKYTVSPLVFSACLVFFLSFFPFPPFYEWFSLVKLLRLYYLRIARAHDLTSAHLLSSSSNATRTLTAASGALGGNISRRGKTWYFAQQRPKRASPWVWKLTQSPTTASPSRRRWVRIASRDSDPVMFSV